MRDFLDNFIIVSVVLVALILVVLMAWASIEERDQWEAFKGVHGCKIVGKKQAQFMLGTGVSSGGKVVITNNTIPAQDGWLCDDGITYWRDR